MVLRRRMMVNPYVTSDIVAYWDGIDNTGNSHDGNASKWIDKINGYEMLFQNNSGRTWNDDNLQLSSGHRGLHTPSRYWSTPEDCTIELVIEPAAVASKVVSMFDPNSTASTMPSGTNARQIEVFADNTIGFFASSHKTYTLPASVSDITKVKKISVIYHNYTVVHAYVNNIEISQGNNTHSYGQFGPNNFRLAEWTNTDNSNTAPFYGKIYAVRYYNRALSSDELTQNYYYDMNRYNI